jgi:hypothetical protein
MSAGGIMGLAEVVKGLQVLSELRPLPTKERELYDNARHLLVTELSASLSISEGDAEDSVDVVLFPPGRERPKRTAAEFARGLGEDGEMGDLGDDLMGLGGDPLDLPDDETVAGAAAAEDDEATVVDAKSQHDDEVTQPTGTAYVPEGELPPKRKRGRPPKPKPPVDPNAPPPEPKRRGRPPKPRPEGLVETEVPRKRGRPPKKKPEPTST